jgi:hypothetical protein
MTTTHFLFIIQTAGQTVLYFRFLSVKSSAPRRNLKKKLQRKYSLGVKFNFHASFSLPLREVINFIIPVRLLATFIIANKFHSSLLIFVFQELQKFSQYSTYATGWKTKELGHQSLHGQEIFSSPHCPNWL